MKRAEIFEKLKEIIKATYKEEINLDNITENSDLVEEIGVNSIVGIEIFVRVEKEFDIEIDDEDLSIETIRTLSIMADYIEKKLDGVE